MLWTSHSFTVLSSLPEARVRPSGENATDLRGSACPLSVMISVWLCTSHSFTVLSALAEARVRPSGEKATDHTPALCPSRVLISFWLGKSHRSEERPVG